MDELELERAIVELANRARGEEPSGSLVPGVLRAVAGEAPRRMRYPGQEPRALIFATFLLLLFLPFFSFSADSALNVVRLVLLLFSVGAGAVSFFKPEVVAEIDRRLLGGRLRTLGPAATRSQEILLFRIQAAYFVMLAVFICRL